MDALHDPDEFLNLLASSPTMTFHVPGDAVIRLDDRRDGSDILAGATIAYWPEAGE
ncbi:hypothetical protein [Mycobacterium avium]|uniref:hypothetical protein n=1 Tax=Mycobacterium avium TaxID=1764 RepID=UPI0015E21D1E|nr:hypothetical protein [Mycobacterium avium]